MKQNPRTKHWKIKLLLITIVYFVVLIINKINQFKKRKC